MPSARGGASSPRYEAEPRNEPESRNERISRYKALPCNAAARLCLAERSDETSLGRKVGDSIEEGYRGVRDQAMNEFFIRNRWEQPI